MTRPKAITPATKIDATNRLTSSSRPAKAPRAPANFQSPAPRLRNKTKGNNNPRPTKVPSKDDASPVFPPRTVLRTTPATKPDTVSQFGMRRLRKSVHPAMIDNRTAPARIAGFKRAPVETCPNFVGIHHAVEEISCVRLTFLIDERFAEFTCHKRISQRGFSHSPNAKSMNLKVLRLVQGPKQPEPGSQVTSKKIKGPTEIGPSDDHQSYLLNAGTALCSATIFFALSARAFACGKSSRPFTTSGSDSARTFIPSS